MKAGIFRLTYNLGCMGSGLNLAVTVELVVERRYLQDNRNLMPLSVSAIYFILILWHYRDRGSGHRSDQQPPVRGRQQYHRDLAAEYHYIHEHLHFV